MRKRKRMREKVLEELELEVNGYLVVTYSLRAMKLKSNLVYH